MRVTTQASFYLYHICISRLTLPLFSPSPFTVTQCAVWRSQETKVYFVGGYRTVQVYLLAELGAGQEIVGPAIIMDSLSTILVEPGECLQRR